MASSSSSPSTSRKPVESGQPLPLPQPVKIELGAGVPADGDQRDTNNERNGNKATAKRTHKSGQSNNEEENSEAVAAATATATDEVTSACVTAKTDKILDIVEQTASDESKKKIYNLVDEIRQLSDLEKLLLYLKLPTGSNVEIDPLKQNCVSSLGSKFEVTQTVTWIETHLEENPEISMPKQEVYDGYTVFCQNVGMKALSAADFGKVMKQVFPRVRPRRLGTRGHSRYCYAGLCKKQRMAQPQLVDVHVAQSTSQEEVCGDSGVVADAEILNVASYLIREWAEKLLRIKFANLKELALYLVENSLVDNRSVAAFTALSCRPGKSASRGNHLMLNQCTGSKHRETQMQLQRKLQEKELIKEQRKKMMEQRTIIGGQSSHLSHKRPGKRSHLCRSPRDTVVAKMPAENGYHEQVTVQDDKCVSSSGSERLVGGPSTANRSRRSSPLPRTSIDGTQDQIPGTPVESSTKGSNGEHGATGSGFDNIGSCRAGKVAIPRVKSGSKMRLQPIPQIFFVPNLSEMTSAQSRIPTKYKPIQPKPANGDGKSPVFKGSLSCDMEKAESVSDCKSTPDSCSGTVRITEGSDASCSSSSLLPEKQGADGDNGQQDGACLKRPCSGGDEIKAKRVKTNEALVVCKAEIPTAPSTPLAATTGRLDCFSHQDSSEEVSISSLENDALIEYIRPNGSGHADPDDELAQYFMGQGMIPSDGNLTNKVTLSTDNPEAHTAKISQLRRLLERNFPRKGPDVAQDTHPSNDVPVLRQLLNGNRDRASGSAPPGYSTFLGGEGPTDRGMPASVEHTTVASFNVSRMVSFGDPHLDGGTAVYDTGDCGTVDFGSLAQNTDMEVDDDNVRFMESQDFSANVYNCNYGSAVFAAEKMEDQQPYGTTEFNGDVTATLDEFSVSELKPSLNATDSDSYFGDTVAEGVSVAGSGSTCPTGAPPPLPLHPACNAIGGHSSVPQSPNTRRRAFNFMPISPQSTPVPDQFPSTPQSSASHSPLPMIQGNAVYPGYGISVTGCVGPSSGVVGAGCLKLSSQPASAANSPFVSPRSTPSSHCRSRHNSGQASSASTFGTPRGTPHGSVVTNLHAVEPSFVAMCASAVGSPFVSPHPTPVPVCRSRHNSNQNVSRLAAVSGQFSVGTGGGNMQNQQPALRSRHPSEMGFPQMSPASAPMSPMEYGVAQIDPDTFLAGHFPMPTVGDTPQMRSRHSSNSSLPPLSPRSAPMSPMVSLGGNSMVDVVSSPSGNFDRQSPFMKPSLIDKPLPSLYRNAVEQLDADQPGSYGLTGSAGTSGQGADGGGTGGGSGQTWSQRSLASWGSVKADPRLASRQRHASHGSAAYSYHGGPMLSSVPQSWGGDQTAQEVSILLEKPPVQIAAMDSHRSQSVPLSQMLQNMGSLNKREQVALQERFSKSYPATPNMDRSFQFQTDVAGELMSAKDTAEDDMDELAPGGGRYAFQEQEAVGDLVDALASDQEPLQDLQATIDDLRACDKDFSKFSQDLQ